jgi:hypothetical protein
LLLQEFKIIMQRDGEKMLSEHAQSFVLSIFVPQLQRKRSLLKPVKVVIISSDSVGHGQVLRASLQASSESEDQRMRIYRVTDK